ncbi:MAG: glycogen/starch/alpha-glucan phosphorylase [Rhodospirillales bacterium]|nr:glycogen/starch/alpha-glucan phosphorylase [Rhodospirillales bacterium]MCW8952527.1 glycogen/starch/alpha-glucan phosphorylase [Rhodospirillales bacterium]MCW8970026.1 glycogen/starch/alpha-glucan phosphorylase [Rhodospirillales bacterium]MCW9001358.1 glycogen/starch/alpha-glucan phosphorylase [Rhodospirillales bacterium]
MTDNVLGDNYISRLSNVESMKEALISMIAQSVGKDPAFATKQDWFYALGFMLRGLLSQLYIKNTRTQFIEDSRRVYYLSMEFLPGRSLIKTLLDLDLLNVTREALDALGQDLDELETIEHDPALGNGGLGRLAACFLDSMAAHGYPGFGYGIRYDFGLFSQSIENGQQVEHPDNWLRQGNPWEFRRPDTVYPVGFYGRLETVVDARGGETSKWVGAENVIAMAYDMPVSGYQNGNVTNLRLWTARATDDFDLRHFNQGDYIKSVEDKTSSETLSKILYPDDSTLTGQELRLKQEYFFVSASLQDIFARFLRRHDNLDQLPEKVVIQLNDTHPTLGIVEMMRLLVDEHGYDWATAWDMTRRTFAYTNHTLLPEALERWPASMIERLLPRHLQIIYRINAEFLKTVEKAFDGDADKIRNLSLVNDYDHSIRMAHLAIVGSYRVNGVAALHTELLRGRVFPDFDAMYPGKFVNITNGITPRRWLLQSNPALAGLITEKLGSGWPIELTQLSHLADYVEDADFRKRFSDIKKANKERLSKMIEACMGLRLDPTAMFDVQIKRIHEYKRQLLNVLHVVTCYNRIRDGEWDGVPRVVIFAGKAAPSYYMAKKVIHLINDLATVINNDPLVGDRLKVVFIPDYRVSLAQVIIPGSDLSEQISTAGMEASGTGNMKLALNGALTIGTLDGANIEIKDAVGEENIFIFGLLANEVQTLRNDGYYPFSYYNGNPELKRALDMIGEGHFSPGDRGRYSSIFDSLLHGGDHFMVLADYESYIAAQGRVDVAYKDQDSWTRMSIHNVASMGGFSADRSIHDYASKIWEVKPLKP